MVTRGLYQVPCQLKSQKGGLSGKSSARLDYSKWHVRVNPCQLKLQKLACPNEALLGQMLYCTSVASSC